MTTTAPILPAIAGTSSTIGSTGAGRINGSSGAGQPGAAQSGRGQSAPGQSGTVQVGADPSRSASTATTAPPLQPGRPLIGGGPFTLAVAFGLQADRRIENSGQTPITGAGGTGGGASGGSSSGGGINELSEEDEELVRDLQARDREVRAHEAAHAAAGGAYAGAPTYTYQRGPDGRQYAVGGSVSIDTSPVQGDPAATIQKAQQIKRAALAPAEPSAQDRSVAAAADALLRQAQAELRAEQRAETQEQIGGGQASVDGIEAAPAIEPAIEPIAGSDIAGQGTPNGGDGQGGFGDRRGSGFGAVPPPPQIISITV